MAKFFAKDPGARVMVQGFGVATTENAVEVPESVAAELAKHPGLIKAEPLKGEWIPVAKAEEIAPKRNQPAKGDKE